MNFLVLSNLLNNFFTLFSKASVIINDFLLSKSGVEGSAVLKILVDNIQYELSKALNGEILDADGNFRFAESLTSGLTNAFNRTFYNGNGGTNFSVKVDNVPIIKDFEGTEVPHIRVYLDYNTGTAELIELPVTMGTLDNNTAIDIIRRFLFDGLDGSGEFRGNSGTKQIPGLNWNDHYSDLETYEDALNNQEENPQNRAKVNRCRALFDDGILTVSQEGIPGVYPYIAAPFDTTGRPVIAPKVSNSDNAGNLKGNSEKQESGEIVETKSVAANIKESIDAVIDKILKYSRKRKQEIEERRKQVKEVRQNVKNHLSATTIAGIMYDTDFSQDSPYFIPSTTMGTDVDSFLRDFFETDNKGNFIFDKNSIDYNKYPTLSQEVLDEMVEGLTVLKNQILSRGETRIISEEVIADGTIKVKLQNGKVLEVPNTGHLDMMTVDNMGKIHVYDFKTFRNEDNFQDLLFNKYAVQLNVYKNLLEQQYGVEVDSVHIIPVTLNYPAASETNVYVKGDQGQLLLNDKEFQLEDPDSNRIGVSVNIQALIDDASSSTQDESSIQAEKMLKALGFTQEEIERLKRNDVDQVLERKKKSSSYAVSLNIPTTAEVSLDLNALSASQRAKVNAIIEQLQKENGEQHASQVAAMEVEAAEKTGIVINSDLNIKNKGQVPNAAGQLAGKEVINGEESAAAKKEEIDQISTCRRKRGSSVNFG